MPHRAPQGTHACWCLSWAKSSSLNSDSCHSPAPAEPSPTCPLSNSTLASCPLIIKIGSGLCRGSGTERTWAGQLALNFPLPSLRDAWPAFARL